MINYEKAIKELRLLREIPQENMLETKNRSQFSKIEQGKLSIKLEDFVEIADTLGVTNEELIVYTNTEDPQEQLLMLFRECVQDLSDTKKKKKFLKLFAPIQKKKDSELSRIEYNFKYSVQASLSSYWTEIESFDQEKVTSLFNHLIDNNYFSQYDYMLALNISKLFSKEQMKMIVSKMFPLKNLITRNALCKQYANLLMTNAISFFVYEKDYDLALKYIKKAQKELNYSDSYYLHLNLLYHKNLTLSLQKNESKYITETRKVIQIVEDIGDSHTASMMTKELDQFIYNPDYSPGRKNIVETSAST